jgi:hypothetical protein
MIVSSSGNRSWDDNTGSVDSLPNIASVDSPSHLFDQNWSESLSSKGFMDTEEIDLCHGDFLSVNTHVHWNSRNETEKFVFLSTSHTEQPILFVSWWQKSPLEELD